MLLNQKQFRSEIEFSSWLNEASVHIIVGRVEVGRIICWIGWGWDSSQSKLWRNYRRILNLRLPKSWNMSSISTVKWFCPTNQGNRILRITLINVCFKVRAVRECPAVEKSATKVKWRITLLNAAKQNWQYSKPLMSNKMAKAYSLCDIFRIGSSSQATDFRTKGISLKFQSDTGRKMSPMSEQRLNKIGASHFPNADVVEKFSLVAPFFIWWIFKRLESRS